MQKMRKLKFESMDSMPENYTKIILLILILGLTVCTTIVGLVFGLGLEKDMDSNKRLGPSLSLRSVKAKPNIQIKTWKKA